MLERIGNTPLLKFERFNHWLGDHGSQILGKAEFCNPGGSVKDRAARQMILGAIESGELTKDKVILDSSSGNTGIAYAMIGTALGYHVELCIPENAQAKARISEAFGAKVIYTDPLEGSDGAIVKAQEMLRERSRAAITCRTNTTTPTTGRPITKPPPRKFGRKPRGKITHFVAGIGTSGTLMGTGRRLKELNPKIEIVAVEPLRPAARFGRVEAHGVFHCPRHLRPQAFTTAKSASTPKTRMKCAADWRGKRAFWSVSRPARALQGAFEVALGMKDAVVVTVLCDGGERYMNSRFWEEMVNYFEKYWQTHDPLQSPRSH